MPIDRFNRDFIDNSNEEYISSPRYFTGITSFTNAIDIWQGVDSVVRQDSNNVVRSTVRSMVPTSVRYRIMSPRRYNMGYFGFGNGIYPNIFNIHYRLNAIIKIQNWWRRMIRIKRYIEFIER